MAPKHICSSARARVLALKLEVGIVLVPAQGFQGLGCKGQGFWVEGAGLRALG